MKRIILVITLSFMVLVPSVNAAAFHEDVGGWSRAKLERYIYSLESRNNRQAVMIKGLWRENAVLRTLYAPYLEVVPVDYATLVSLTESGVSFGQLYVAP